MLKLKQRTLIKKRHSYTGSLARENEQQFMLEHPPSFCCSTANLLRLFTSACSLEALKFSDKQSHSKSGIVDKFIKSRKVNNTLFLLYLLRC